MVAFHFLELFLDLGFLGLGLLQAKDIRRILMQPIPEAFLIHRAEAVHVPR
jgi:hypothetical protein